MESGRGPRILGTGPKIKYNHAQGYSGGICVVLGVRARGEQIDAMCGDPDR
jgi:hypothetical protein